jgi:hypothetical protein
MGTIADSAISVLSPFVGSMAANTCVRGTALALGKMSDELSPADLPTLADNIRRLLEPLAPSATVEQLIAQIEGGVS